MINKIKVVNSYGEELTMTLREPQLSGYAITEISGIGPTDVDIKQSQFVSGRKYKYNAGFHKYREINLSIVYYEDNMLLMDVVQLRNNLYKYFKTNDRITLYFEKDDVQYSIIGYVSKHEPVIWSDNCNVKIVILCPDPWFRKYDVNYLDTFNSSYDNSTNYVDINYRGNISSGFKITTNDYIEKYGGKTLTLNSVHLLTGVSRFFVINIPTSINYETDTNMKLSIDLLSDIINVGTIVGDDLNTFKNRNGWIDATSISKRQEIPELFPESNRVSLSVSNDSSLSYKILYNTLYRGL